MKLRIPRNTAVPAAALVARALRGAAAADRLGRLDRAVAPEIRRGLDGAARRLGRTVPADAGRRLEAMAARVVAAQAAGLAAVERSVVRRMAAAARVGAGGVPAPLMLW